MNNLANMSNVVLSIQRGSWAAHVIDRNKPPMDHAVAESIRFRVCVVHPQGYLTSWPIRYDNGQIGYEHEPSRDERRAVVLGGG